MGVASMVVGGLELHCFSFQSPLYKRNREVRDLGKARLGGNSLRSIVQRLCQTSHYLQGNLRWVQGTPGVVILMMLIRLMVSINTIYWMMTRRGTFAGFVGTLATVIIPCDTPTLAVEALSSFTKIAFFNGSITAM
ncbi:unnamed protein product [Fraxinus pennsylvanica]|uniref:Uncharacterized protein n=1 Tax=Fraxinus pennsylvanica TaxID=56036 RepID=A0AAD1ZKF1_9LAMI|nr:unnamed protein product [Fraxinus pennsylvanica]